MDSSSRFGWTQTVKRRNSEHTSDFGLGERYALGLLQRFESVFDELSKFSGSQFDPNCVTAMLRLLEREGPDFIRKNQKFDIYEFIES